MSNITLIMLSAGNSSRFNLRVKKQWLRCGDIPLWLYVTNTFDNYNIFDKIIVVGNRSELNYMQNFTNRYDFVVGGNTRQQSIQNALQKVTTKYVMITDVARSCIPKNVILELIKNKDKADIVVPYLNVSDTVTYQNDTICRNEVKIIQTPQLSLTNILKKALDTKDEFTDDSSAVKNIGGTVFYTKGSNKSKKITFDDDLSDIKCLVSVSSDHFVGIGFDVHPFVKNRQMVLGGVKIDSSYGFEAHSDGDVLIHSLIDALLGASALGDIGEFFPDTNTKYKDISSVILLDKVIKIINSVGFEIINIDITIIAQIPKINPYKQEIKSKLAKILNLPIFKINIKATTTENLGFIGKKEGIAVQSIATLKFYDWTK